MPFSDDYAIISGTGWDCNATTGWSTTGGTVVAPTTSSDSVEGTNSIILQSSGAGTCTWYNNNLTNFRIDQQDVMFWFKYAKGKSPPYLNSTNTAIQVRAYTNTGGGGTYFEYDLTQFGDEELLNDWQVFQISGSNSSRVNGSPSVTSNIVRLELVLTFLNANNGGDDNPLLMDCWFAGTKINVEQTATVAQLQAYSDGNNSHGGSTFPLGLVKESGGFLNLKSGLQIGGSSAGSMTILNTFILFNQFSNEVKHELTVKSNGTFVVGELDSGEPVRGCQLVLPANRLSDVVVENGGTFRAFGSKLFRFRDLFLGAASDSSSTVELRTVDIGSCETVYFRSNTLDIENVQIHDNDNNNRDWACEITVSPDSCKAFLLYSNVLGAKFTASVSIEEFLAQDNTTDFTVVDPATVTLTNSIYNPSLITRSTS